MSLVDGPAAPATKTQKPLDLEKAELTKKQTYKDFAAGVAATDDDNDWAKMSQHEYRDKYQEVAKQWPVIQQDAIDAKKRKEFDDVEENLRRELEAFNLLEKQPVLGAAPPPPAPAPQSGGWFGWGKKAEEPKPQTSPTNTQEVAALHKRLQDAKKNIAADVRRISSVVALRDQPIDKNGETVEAAQADGYSYHCMDSSNPESQSGAQVSAFHAMGHHEKTAFQRPILHGQQLRSERATKLAHQEAMAKLDKVSTPVLDATVANEMYQAKKRAAVALKAGKK